MGIQISSLSKQQNDDIDLKIPLGRKASNIGAIIIIHNLLNY